MQQAAIGGSLQAGLQEMIEIYNEKFGLNTPSLAAVPELSRRHGRLDFNYSIANYPQRVTDIIGRALPWTIVLLTTTTLLSWVIGTLLGAFLALAARAEVPALPDAAAAGAERHPVLLARPDPDLSLRVSACGSFPLLGGYTPGHVPRR